MTDSIQSAIATAHSASSILTTCIRAVDSEHPMQPGHEGDIAVTLTMASKRLGKVIEAVTKGDPQHF